MTKNKTCYVVSIEGVETASIQAICLSEKTARKQFYITKKKVLKDSKASVKRLIGRDRDADTIKYYTDKVAALQKLRYPGTNINVWVWESPIVRMFELLE